MVPIILVFSLCHMFQNDQDCLKYFILVFILSSFCRKCHHLFYPEVNNMNLFDTNLKYKDILKNMIHFEI
jgi:hypothetical protein